MATRTTPEIRETLEFPTTNEERRERETVVLEKWQASELTIREAAEQLGLSYGEFLELLDARGVPVERSPVNLDAVQMAVQKLRGSSE